MRKFYSGFAYFYFLLATILLMLISLLLLGNAVWQIFSRYNAPGDLVDVSLNGIGLIIIGFAVVETAKFIAEEELLRSRELRSSLESRRSITKFTTIIVIAMSLEALVMVFRANHDRLNEAIYPAILFSAAMFALIALGIYQYLSSRIQPPSTADSREVEESSPD
ncbi:MAG: hypothetical protein JJ913_08975 [Rhizobiaceae bacterium]|nr:hypothetical protein [Rhizobiaceae bacterium]